MSINSLVDQFLCLHGRSTLVEAGAPISRIGDLAMTSACARSSSRCELSSGDDHALKSDVGNAPVYEQKSISSPWILCSSD